MSFYWEVVNRPVIDFKFCMEIREGMAALSGADKMPINFPNASQSTKFIPYLITTGKRCGELVFKSRSMTYITIKGHSITEIEAPLFLAVFVDNEIVPARDVLTNEIINALPDGHYDWVPTLLCPKSTSPVIGLTQTAVVMS